LKSIACDRAQLYGRPTPDPGETLSVEEVFVAEVSVDERRLLKTMRWYDGFVIGLANPGFLIVGIGFSVGALGAKVAAILWFVSALVGALQAYVYSEPAAMFPDKPGGLAMYAKEGWRKYFSLAGPIATFGYWFAWSSVLAIYGGLIGFLLVGEFFTSLNSKGVNTDSIGSWTANVAGVDFTTVRVIGLICILLCWAFNVRGMRPAVWLSYATGVAMAVPVIVLAVGPFVTGNISNHAVNGNAMSSTLTGVFGESASTWHQFGLIMVWLYVLGWSTYGPEAPATFAPEFIDTKNDTRKAIVSTGAFNVFLSALLPLAVVGTLGYSAIAGDLTGIVYMIDVLKAIVGDFFGGVLVVCLCAGLLLSMNTATMDGSRALFGMARDGLTVKQLSVLNSHHVPGRAMTLDMVMNVCLLMFFPSIFFVLAAGNLGYILSHVLALSGVLLLRKDRPAWPRPIKLGPIWMVLAGAFAVYNLLLIVFGLAFLKLTGYAWNYAFTDPSAFTNRIILVGVLVLVAGVAGYVIGQRQVGRPFRWTDPSDESPTAEAYETAGLAVPATAGH
jgi:amino acid transporter